ncbi:TetR family transcriptional regulator [Neosynechococcus sphagnicola sy1]|uniref:TetR family transcriptional regulator n=1 Tax=Neosynechococcus sphagnicola sy1 TaxID=1497020 RepID=A0A098TIG9_9CYAN|nr:TetR/AcrR family transcriptional regulator [Neosynechococcus sphagnicola]KGF71821.1 TetR family transcriptional regulator [Neosynechococcus sphagnicola sy1]
MAKAEVIPQLMAVFQEYGYEGASITRFSEATGLKRASLYHYFPNGKEEMADAVLDYVTQALKENLLAPLRSNRPPGDRIQAMNQNVDAFYQQGQQDCLLALLSVGEAHELFQERVQRALNLWIDSVAAVLVDAGITPITARQRAEEAIALIQGALVLTRGLNNTAIFERILQQMPESLLRPE